MNTELTSLQNNWQNTFTAAKNAAQKHQKAIKAYQDKQTAKGWYSDFDLCAQTNGAVTDLYAAYQELQNICLVLYNQLLEQQAQQQTQTHQKTERLYTGTGSIKTTYWEFFLAKGGLIAFTSPNCPAEDRANIIAFMQKDIAEVPALQKAIDYLQTI